MEDSPVHEDGDIRCAATNIGEDDPLFLLLLLENGFCGSERCEDQFLDLDAGAFDALREVLDRGHGAGHDMRVHVEPLPEHSDGVADMLLPVHDEEARNVMQHLAIGREAKRLGTLHRPVDIFLRDRALLAGDRADPPIVQRGGVVTSDAHVGRHDAAAARPLGAFDGISDRLGGLLDVVDHAFLHALRRSDSNAEDTQVVVGRDLGYQRADLAAPYIYAGEYVVSQRRTSCLIGMRDGLRNAGPAHGRPWFRVPTFPLSPSRRRVCSPCSGYRRRPRDSPRRSSGRDLAAVSTRA